MATRTGNAEWKGNLQEGEGTVASESGAVDASYSFSRFVDEPTGSLTNPEELIAAAHASCFSMALSHELSEAGHVPDSIRTTAKVDVRPQPEGGFAITRSALETEGRVPGIDADEFQRFAEGAKAGCPVSKALGAIEVELEARLVS
jgi:lipoyl-dependent peroxiredoxin